MKRPNIVFYFADQQRWDTLGCYGQPLPVTPNLDQIAENGVLFQNAFTCQPVCGPARACLQTGVYATENGCYRNAIALPSSKETLAEYLNSAGYHTAYIGKWHLASNGKEPGECFATLPVPPERRGGYQYWMAADVLEFTSHGYNGYVYNGAGEKMEFIGYRPDCVNNFAIDYLHQRKDQEQPFFLFVSQLEPHHQNDHERFEGPDGSKERFARYQVPGDLEGTQGNWRENYPDYLGACHSLDENVGRLVDTLKELGMWENTIFIYTSDHGSHFCTRNSEYKRSCHESSIHVPLIIHGPSFSGGTRVEELVSLLDLPATLLQCAGVSVPAHFQGQPLQRLASGDAKDWPQEVFLQISESQVGRAIRTKKWKYSVRADADGWNDSGADTYYEDFLYDLETDPHERCNLVESPDHEPVRRMLAERLKQRMKAAGEKVPAILPARNRPA